MRLWQLVGPVETPNAPSAALVGVAIAVAPFAATVGLERTAIDVIAAASVGIFVRVTASSIDAGRGGPPRSSLDTRRVRGDGTERRFLRRTDRRALLRRAVLLVVTVFVLTSALAVTTVTVSENADFERTVTDVAADADARVLSVEISHRRDLFLRHPSAVTVRLVGGSRETAVELRTGITAETGRDVAVTVIHEDGPASRA